MYSKKFCRPMGTYVLLKILFHNWGKYGWKSVLSAVKFAALSFVYYILRWIATYSLFS